jgi:hypothetical protein
MINAAAYPHPALTGHLLPQAGEGFFGLRAFFSNVDEALCAPPLPLAGESWGEGKPLLQKISGASCS